MPAPEISKGIPAVYVDNFIYTADDPKTACVAFDAVKSRCLELRLPVHEEVRGQQHMTSLGWAFDGKRCEIRPTATRVWRFYLALEHVVMTNPYLNRKQLEVLVGHFTFLALLRRPLLSITHAVYSYIQKGFVRPRRIWPSVLRELRWMRSSAR